MLASIHILHQDGLCLQCTSGFTGLTVSKRSYHKLVVVTVGLLAVAAHVEVLADRAAEPGARLDLHLALVAGGGEGGRLGVVQMVQDHHAAVLGAAHAVELVVVALAERQELLRPAHRCQPDYIRIRMHPSYKYHLPYTEEG